MQNEIAAQLQSIMEKKITQWGVDGLHEMGITAVNKQNILENPDYKAVFKSLLEGNRNTGNSVYDNAVTVFLSKF
jgi:hypothetical protein